MKRQQAILSRARDLRHQFRIPPDVIDVERNAERTGALRIEPVANIQRLLRRIYAGAVRGIGRMQRLDCERHVGLLRVFQHFGDSVMDLRARGRDIFRSSTSRPRILRQAADDQHHAGRAQRLGFVDGAAIVVTRFDAARRIRREHAAATIARQFESSVAHRPHRTVEAYGRHLVAPGIYGADAMPRAGLDDGDEIALLADRRRVQRQPAMIGGKIAHQGSMPRVASTVFMRRVASSGLERSPALSAKRNSSARCSVERVLSCPPTMVK